MTDTNVAPAPAAKPPQPYTPQREAFELELRRAKVLAASTLLPDAYRDNLPNCMIAMNMANRIGADVMQVAQNLYIVHGKPGWSGQFLIATFNQSGKYSAIRYEWQGKQGDKEWGCRAWAIEKETQHRIDGPWVTWAMVEAEKWNAKTGSKWLTMPTLMFHYRAAAFLIRTHAPEIAMGLQTVEEIGDVYDGSSSRVVGSNQSDELSAIDSINAAVTNGASLAPPAVDPTIAAARTGATMEGEKTKDNATDTQKKETKATNPGGAPFSYPELAARINQAVDTDALDIAVSTIDDAIKDEKQRAELRDIARAKRIELD